MPKGPIIGRSVEVAIGTATASAVETLARNADVFNGAVPVAPEVEP